MDILTAGFNFSLKNNNIFRVYYENMNSLRYTEEASDSYTSIKYLKI